MLENLPLPPATPGPIKEEITSLGLTPKSNRSKKLKVALIVFAFFFLLASVPTAVYLVKQREVGQEVKGEECQPGQFVSRCEGECAINGRLTNYKVTYQCVDGSWQRTTMEHCDIMECGDDGPAPGGPTPRDGGDCECSEVKDQDPDCIANHGVDKSPHCDGCKCVGGDCVGDPDCAQWEVCKDGSCRSKEGCAKDSDCLTGKCVGGYCSGPGQLECHADETGVSVVNNTGSPVSGNVTWYSSLCAENPNCGCSGSSRSTPINLGTSDSDKTWSMPITGSGCAWQSDVAFSNCHNADNGCIPGCGGATPTPPTYNIACEFCRVYDSSWNRIIDFSTITVGQTVYFATTGSTTHAQGITKARFRINSGVWQETTNKHEDKFFIQYTIPSATTYTIESMVYNPTLGWY